MKLTVTHLIDTNRNRGILKWYLNLSFKVHFYVHISDLSLIILHLFTSCSFYIGVPITSVQTQINQLPWIQAEKKTGLMIYCDLSPWIQVLPMIQPEPVSWVYHPC